MNKALQELRQKVEGKKILIFGLGIQGGGTRVAQLLHELGAIVRVSDKKSPQELAVSLDQLPPEIQVSVGEQKAEDVDWAELIMKNPGVPYSHPLIQRAQQRGIPVTTETALALSIVRDRSIGITGTRGKSTTTALIQHILKNCGVDAFLCGNIPQKPTLAVLAEANDTSWFVIEMSSYHIEACLEQKVSPHIAVLTNIYPDHLDRYESIHAYAQTKMGIFQFQRQEDLAFLPKSVLQEWGRDQIFLGQLGLVDQNRVETIIHEYPNSLLGEHNQENVALATLVAESFGLQKSAIQEAVRSFPGLPYRLETVGEKEGIRFINDTTSTTPTALEKALDAVTFPHVLIVGGATKKLPFTETLLQKIRQQLPYIIWLEGSGTSELMRALNLPTPEFVTASSLGNAVEQAWQMAQHSHRNAILFSPGFTSFEMFKNEFDRGDQFNSLVQKRIQT